jgi:NADPH:quinone reductase-like Zn-dependent oxidoreductase
MRRIVIHRAGSYDQLALEDHPDPTPAPGEVLIAVEAIGVNYADVIIRWGLYASAKEFVGWPITPGFEVSGTVAAVGSEVKGWTPGDEVIAVTRFGGYASHLAVPQHQVFARPVGFSSDEAAGFPAVFLTAHYALFFLAHPRPGDTLLIHSAAGGVGGALLQLARIAGCRSLAVVGAAHKVDAAKKLGATIVIDKSSESLWDVVRSHAPDGCEVVLDGNGAATLRESYAHLASPGKLVTYGFHSMFPKNRGRPKWTKLALDFLKTPRFSPLQLCTDNKSILAANLSYLFPREALLREAMEQLLTWVREGKIQPPATTSYPLAEAGRAHRDLESGQTIGKLVLKP